MLPTSNGKIVRTSSSPPPGVIEIWDTLYSNLTVSRLENMPRTMYLHTQLNTIDITIKEDIFWTNCSDILIICIIERDMALLLIINENKCGLTITLAKTMAIFYKVQNRFKTLLFVIIR